MPHPAIVISAGPGLAKLWRWCDEESTDQTVCIPGVHESRLARPSLLEAFCLIAVQTALKPLLAHGIRPHFVCALDYSELSGRFYEGLTAADVKGITLVLDPKVHPCVPRAWPGRIRFTRSATIDLIMGDEPDRSDLDKGGTVAHMAYHLARYMGADPVIMVGQDLAFTHGQYYSDGAAIHNVWSCELGEFCTLEMREWERVKRTPPAGLVKIPGRNGEVYTDLQMLSYLRAFEGMWEADAAKGLRTIVTDDGAVKAHTEWMELEEALK